MSILNKLFRNKDGKLSVMRESSPMTLNVSYDPEFRCLDITEIPGLTDFENISYKIVIEEGNTKVEVPITSSGTIKILKYIKPEFGKDKYFTATLYENETKHQVIVSNSFCKKEFSIKEEFEFAEDGTIKKYLGTSDTIHINGDEIPGFYSEFYINSKNIKNIYALNIKKIGSSAFFGKNFNINLDGSNPIEFEKNTFRGFEGKIKIAEGIKLIFAEGESEGSLAGLPIKKLNNPLQKIDFEKNPFKGNKTVEDIFYLSDSKGAFGPYYFEGMENLKNILTYGCFVNKGHYPEGIFKNCRSLETYHDLSNTRLYNSQLKHILPVNKAENHAFFNCETLPKKNVFLIHTTTQIKPMSFYGVKHPTFIYLDDTCEDPSPEEVIEKHNLPKDSFIFDFETKYFKNDYQVRSNENYIFVGHRLSQKTFHNYILKFISDDHFCSLADFSQYGPFEICKYAFSDCAKLRTVFIPKTIKKIHPEAFKGNRVTVFMEGYPENYGTEVTDALNGLPVFWGTKEEDYAKNQR